MVEFCFPKKKKKNDGGSNSQRTLVSTPLIPSLCLSCILDLDLVSHSFIHSAPCGVVPCTVSLHSPLSKLFYFFLFSSRDNPFKASWRTNSLGTGILDKPNIFPFCRSEFLEARNGGISFPCCCCLSVSLCISVASEAVCALCLLLSVAVISVLSLTLVSVLCLALVSVSSLALIPMSYLALVSVSCLVPLSGSCAMSCLASSSLSNA